MRATDVVKAAKDWWWLITLTLGGIIFVGTLPRRLESVEAGVKEVAKENTQQNRLLDRLTYIAEQNEQLQRQQMQQLPNAAYDPMMRNLPNPAPTRWQWEQDDDGNWFCRYADGSWAWPNDQEACE